MKPKDLKDLRKETGVSRIWLPIAAAAGAAVAYLVDPDRGTARRQAARRRLSGVTHTAVDRTSKWRELVSSRFSGKPGSQTPDQVAIPVDRHPKAIPALPPEGKAETKKPLD
ncbi:MAG: hypothetical protein ABI401_08230 [Candidatus Dormibacter sp.]